MKNLLTYSHWEHTDFNPIRNTFLKKCPTPMYRKIFFGFLNI